MNRSIHLLLPFLFLFALINVSANPPAKATLSGVVLDMESSMPLEYVTISILNSDSSLFTGGSTNQQGSFNIPDLTLNEKYLAKIQFIGYQAKMIEVELTTKNTILDTIYLVKDMALLDAVAVTTEASEVENHIDKKVYNAEQINVSGNNGLDLLSSIPSVQVDENDVISFRGSENVTILINGRPTSMSAAQYLKMLSSTSIEKIELITNPSAKYDAEGMSGIINIITKKSKEKGSYGSLNTSIGLGFQVRSNSSFSFNHNQGKLRVYFRYGLNDYRGITTSYTERGLLDNNEITDLLLSTGSSISKSLSHTVNGGVDYFLNDKNTLYFNGAFNTRLMKRNNEVEYLNYDANNSLIMNSYRTGYENVPLGSKELNVGWQNTFGNQNNTLDLDIDWAPYFMNATEEINENIYNETDYTTLTSSTEENNLLIAKLDFKIPINDSTIIETGARSTLRGQTSGLNVETTENSNPIDSSSNSYFTYDQLVLASYFSFEKQLNNFGFKTGLRAEQTYTESNLQGESQVFTNDYFHLFPSVHLSYNTSEQSNLSLSYGKRINRPTLTMINPFRYYSDRFLVEYGNPYLQPEIIHVSELGYSRFGDKINFNGSLYHRFILNKLRRHLQQLDQLSVITYKNIASGNLIGADMSVVYKLNKSIRITGVVDVWNVHVSDSIITNNEMVSTYGISTNLNLAFRLKSGWSIQVRNRFRPKYNIQQGHMLAKYATNIGIKKGMLDNNLVFNASITDVFNTLGSYLRSNDNMPYLFNADWEWQSRVLYLSVTWNFGKKTKSKSKRRSVDIDASDHGKNTDM